MCGLIDPTDIRYSGLGPKPAYVGGFDALRSIADRQARHSPIRLLGSRYKILDDAAGSSAIMTRLTGTDHRKGSIAIICSPPSPAPSARMSGSRIVGRRPCGTITSPDGISKGAP